MSAFFLSWQRGASGLGSLPNPVLRCMPQLLTWHQKNLLLVILTKTDWNIGLPWFKLIYFFIQIAANYKVMAWHLKAVILPCKNDDKDVHHQPPSGRTIYCRMTLLCLGMDLMCVLLKLFSQLQQLTLYVRAISCIAT